MAEQFNQNKIKDIAFKYAEAVKLKYNVSDIYLFGGFATGNANVESDIDIAVISDEFTGDIVDDTFELMRLRRKIDVRIEPHPFLQKDFTQNNPFAREIINTGISLY